MPWLQHLRASSSCRVFHKELYNFQMLSKSIQRACTVFWTVIIWQNTPSFIWNINGSMRCFKKRFTMVFQILLCGECYENAYT
jgi:hypothetical protein